ncbi:MAG: OB-fold nucleic acid binding domain-containing protein [Pseudomonadota bacterium]
MDIPAAPAEPHQWPRPPACLPAAWLDRPPNGARIMVAGLVLVRQRPGTAKGVIFITLEDETGVCNVIVWRHIYETFRRAVIAGRLLRVLGKVQRESAVTHVIAEQVEDISPMLDDLIRPEIARAGDQPHNTYPDPRAGRTER